MADKQVLRQVLVEAYNRDELRVLATDISGNDEIVFSANGTIETWAVELISWCGRRNKSSILIESIKKGRPEVYKEYESKLEKKIGSQWDEIQTEKKDIEEAVGPLRARETKKKPVSGEGGKSRKSRHPLAGTQRAVHAWFKKLDTEQQVFVTSAALFSGLQRDDLMSLYRDLQTLLGVSGELEKKAEE